MKKKVVFSAILVIILTLGFTSCEEENVGEKGNIVNSAGQAWVTNSLGPISGYIFKADGTFDFIMEDEPDGWYVMIDGTYSTSGSTLVINLLTEQQTFTYSVSGNTLRMSAMGQTFTYTRTNVLPTNHTPLTNGQWTEGTLTENVNVIWYSFAVTAGTTYNVWWNDYDGDGEYDTDIRVWAIYSNLYRIFNQDAAWSIPRTFTASSTGTVYLRVIPFSNDIGDFAIVYSTSNTRPD